MKTEQCVIGFHLETVFVALRELAGKVRSLWTIQMARKNVARLMRNSMMLTGIASGRRFEPGVLNPGPAIEKAGSGVLGKCSRVRPGRAGRPIQASTAASRGNWRGLSELGTLHQCE